MFVYVRIHLVHACPYAAHTYISCMSIILWTCMHEMYSYIHNYALFWTWQVLFCAHAPVHVQPPVVGVPIPAVGKDKSLHAPLCLFLGQVLDEGEPALESNHGFVNRELAGGVHYKNKRVKK